LFLILRCMYVVSDVSEKDRTGGRQAHQLPPGRHGLSRSFVAENQRERILAAVADVVSAASYAEMTVEGIIVTAGVSRRTFYEHFKNKDDAFLAAYDAITAQLVGEVLPAVDAADGFAARVAPALAPSSTSSPASRPSRGCASSRRWQPDPRRSGDATTPCGRSPT
jgi:AcrR family transcriptional regulator